MFYNKNSVGHRVNNQVFPMVARSKLYEQLDQLEGELERKLIPHLQHAANGDNDYIFCVEQFNPFKKYRENTDKVSESLVNLGAQILSLRKKLGESSENTIADKICGYCHQWNECVQTEEKCARQLAQQFLDEIKSLC